MENIKVTSCLVDCPHCLKVKDISCGNSSGLDECTKVNRRLRDGGWGSKFNGKFPDWCPLQAKRHKNIVKRNESLKKTTTFSGYVDSRHGVPKDWKNCGELDMPEMTKRKSDLDPDKTRRIKVTIEWEPLEDD